MNDKQTNNLRRRVERVLRGVLRQANEVIPAGKSVHKYKEVLFKEWMDKEIRKMLIGLQAKDRDVVIDPERGIVRVPYVGKEPYTPEEQYKIVRSYFNTTYFNAVRPLFTAVRAKYIGGGDVYESAYDMVMSGEMQTVIDNCIKQFEF